MTATTIIPHIKYDRGPSVKCLAPLNNNIETVPLTSNSAHEFLFISDSNVGFINL